MILPERFIQQMSHLLGEQYPEFAKAMSESPSVSIKLNRRKTLDVFEAGYTDTEPVKWCNTGFYLKERPAFTLNPLLHAGVFYVQDASSMIYEAITEKIVSMAFDTGRPLRILDLCAAPGGKTTSIINAVPDGTLVVANEYAGSRANILKENLLKWGYPDIVVTNSPASGFAALPEFFDIVAVDAPCSGEGMMRKEEVAVSQWNEGLQKQCASLQRQILDDAFATLKPGGFMIYSTCTFNRLEDEENVHYLAENHGMVPIDMEFPEDWGIASGIDPPYPCLRFMPHITRGEGLFVAVLRKEGESPTPGYNKSKDPVQLLKSKLKVICDGIPRMVVKGKDKIPTTESVLATDYQTGTLPEVDADLDMALCYLRHEAVNLCCDISKGIVVITYKGHPLGLVKNIGQRANNLYPSSWRIRMTRNE